MNNMRVLSRNEVEAWCQANDVALYRKLPDLSKAEFKFKIPSGAQARIDLVNRGMKIFEDENQFLVWFTTWGVWDSGQERYVFERFRMSYGITQPLIDSPGHIFDQSEVMDAVSFVTIAVLFLWDCHIVVPNQRKLLYFSHDEFGMSKGVEFSGSERLYSTEGIRPHILPIWWTDDVRAPPAEDPIGCPVSVEQMVEYLRPLLHFTVQVGDLEFLSRGKMNVSSYWLWAFYGDDRRRWNIIVFSDADIPGGPTRTWMRADNNPYDLSDRDYVIAMHDKEY